jgi:hypothetical protein
MATCASGSEDPGSSLQECSDFRKNKSHWKYFRRKMGVLIQKTNLLLSKNDQYFVLAENMKKVILTLAP